MRIDALIDWYFNKRNRRYMDFPEAAAEERFGGHFQRVLWPEIAGVRTIGAIRVADGNFELTESGYYLWVVLMRKFFTGVNSLREDMRHNIAGETAILPAR